MFATGKYLKDKAANSRRAATTLRLLANDGDLSIADRGVMLAAAAVVETLASKSAKLGKERQASEADYERRITAARQQAKKLVSQLPDITLLDKVALISLVKNRLKYLIDELNTEKQPDRLIRSLEYWVENATGELSSEIASAFVTKKTDMADSLEIARGVLKSNAASDHVVMIAKRYEQLTKSTSEAA